MSFNSRTPTFVTAATLLWRRAFPRGCPQAASTRNMSLSYVGSSRTALTQSTGLRTFVEGKENGPVVVFVHGWPDDHLMFSSQVDHLKDRYRCITTDLPGFHADGCDNGAEGKGFSIDEVVDRLEVTIEEAGNGSPVTVVAHDWGCMYSFIVERRRPELFKRIVALDVGGAVDPPLIGLLVITSYHLWLIAAFLVGGPLGDAMARSFARLVGAPDAARVATARSCYPYYHWWKKKLDRTQEQIGPLMPKAPLLFLYGSAGYKGYLMFHADWWAKEVDQKKGSASVAMTGSKHWITADQSDDLNRRLDAFLQQE